MIEKLVLWLIRNFVKNKHLHHNPIKKPKAAVILVQSLVNDAVSQPLTGELTQGDFYPIHRIDSNGWPIQDKKEE